MYVCNCNGIRERDVQAAIERGVRQPAAVFARHECKAKCGRCINDMRMMIRRTQVFENIAAE
jgi:bacterioferritin-associated ferredoxin